MNSLSHVTYILIAFGTLRFELQLDLRDKRLLVTFCKSLCIEHQDSSVYVCFGNSSCVLILLLLDEWSEKTRQNRKLREEMILPDPPVCQYFSSPN